MPELPEVETTCRGIQPHIIQQTVTSMIIRQPQLRWPIPADLPSCIQGHRILSVSRRAKYILIYFNHGKLLIHLGMSGNLRIVTQATTAGKHDHVDWLLQSGHLLRFNDPRRFGAILWQTQNTEHPLFSRLGPEPLAEDFNAEYLLCCCHQRKQAIKQRIMDQQVVVGVGNIYASEALFYAGIDPRRPSGEVSLQALKGLVREIKRILNYAISRGGTTLRDFVGGDGKPGYFQQELAVYGRKNQACIRCAHPLNEIRLGQRSSVYCSHCQH